MDNIRTRESYDSDGARQGVTGHGVRYVLAWSLLAIILAFAVVAALN